MDPGIFSTKLGRGVCWEIIMAMARYDMGLQAAPGDDTPASLTPEGLERFTFNALHMGGEVRLTFYVPTLSVAEATARSVFARFAELEQVMSDYRPSSELMRLCSKAGQGPTKVSADLCKVLAYSLDVSRSTEGAFDVTASPVVRLWRETRRTGVMPSPGAARTALAKVGYQKVKLDPLHQEVTLEVPGMQLDLGGIAKGYANDEAIRVFRRHGIRSAMVEAGGDIAVSEAPPNKQGWLIKVRGQDDPIYLKNAAISTSGDTEQFVEIEGVRYSHVVDPRTGIGVASRVQATVIAPCGLVSDPWGTALCVNPFLVSPLGSTSMIFHAPSISS